MCARRANTEASRNQLHTLTPPSSHTLTSHTHVTPFDHSACCRLGCNHSTASSLRDSPRRTETFPKGHTNSDRFQGDGCQMRNQEEASGNRDKERGDWCRASVLSAIVAESATHHPVSRNSKAKKSRFLSLVLAPFDLSSLASSKCVRLLFDSFGCSLLGRRRVHDESILRCARCDEQVDSRRARTPSRRRRHQCRMRECMHG